MDLQHYIGNRDEFPILKNWNFLNHAAVAPIPHCAAEAVKSFAVHASEHAYIDSGWYRQIEELRKLAASFIGADRQEIAFIKNTSEGLATVANGLDWRDGDRVISTAVEYPANVYPWMDLAKRRGIEFVRVQEVVGPDGARRVPQEQIIKVAEHPRTRMITLSHVEFGSGQRHDLVTIGRFCRERDILLCVDAIQSLGVLPVNVREMNIDFLSADGHKWMIAPEGAGIFYCRRELIEKVHPVLVGWMNVANALDFDKIDYTLRPDAARFECGSLNVPGLLGLKASLEMIASIGIDNIWQRVRMLTDRLIDGLRELGFTVASPRSGQEASGIVSFGREGLDIAAVAKRLQRERRIELATRAGRLRCSPHFYNTTDNIDELLRCLSEDAAIR